jgi:hypothetical protein
VLLSTGATVTAQERSHVFMKNWDAAGAAKHRVDGVTSLVFPSLVDADALAEFKTTVAEVNRQGRISVGRIPLDYRIYIYEQFAEQEGEDLDEHICRGVEGELIDHPNGNIFLCSNSPFVRRAMKRMADICAEAGCDWISADLQTATHDSLKLGGCFCRHCETGFAAYRNKPETWSYRELLVSRGYDTTTKIRAEARRRGEASEMPFYREYRTFQHFALRGCYDEIRGERKFLTSQDFHGHSAPMGTHGDFDYVGEGLWGLENAEIPLLYRLTDAAGRFNYVTEGPEGDWENDPLMRLRLCQAYAYGAAWVVPYQQPIKRDGKWRRLDPPVADLYTFIRDHRQLLDGYEPWVSVGLIYSHLGHRYGAMVSEEAVGQLVRNNVPFRICVAGSDWWDPGFDLSGLSAFVKSRDSQYLSENQQKQLRNMGRPVVEVESLEELWTDIERPIRVSIGDEKLNVVPRRNGRRRALHLVNMIPGGKHGEFTVTLSRQFAGEVVEATLHAPGSPPAKLACTNREGFTSIAVPRLEEWGIVAFDEPATARPQGQEGVPQTSR